MGKNLGAIVWWEKTRANRVERAEIQRGRLDVVTLKERLEDPDFCKLLDEDHET